MSIPSPFRRPLTALVAAALILFGPGSPASAIDDNATKQVWKLKYAVLDDQISETAPYQQWLSKDDDGDGLKNGDECAAGTNPFKNSSTVKVSSVVKNGANAELQFPTQSGKRYRVESSSPLGGAWTLQPQPTPVQVIGDGTVKMLAVAYAANTFYRVRVDDVDTDGEGVGDWVELAVNLDPNDQTTEPGVNDLDYLNEQIALPSVVSIEAAESFATEDGDVPGKLTVTRTQNLFPVTVNLNVTGTATPGADYTALPPSVPFAARGVMSVDLMVDPVVPQAQINGSRSVTVGIAVPPAAEFPVSLGTPSSATVIIKDTTAPTGTGLRARYYDNSNVVYTDAANFTNLKVDRVDPKVDYNWVAAAPDGSMGTDSFSVRWTGQMQPQYSEDYTIAVLADDGVRLWINGKEQNLKQTAEVLVTGSSYFYDNSTGGDAVVTFTGSSIGPGTVAVNDVVRLDPTSGTVNLGVGNYNVLEADANTFKVNFGTSFASGGGSISMDALNRVIKPWASNTNERYVRIPLIAGVRYDIQLDYWEDTLNSRCHLYWFSPSQPKEIIPTNRLYPSNGLVLAPAEQVTPTSAVALVGGLFSLDLLGSNNGTVTFGAPLPSWLSFNLFTGGTLTGTPGPGDVGDYQIVVTITNADGTSTSVVNIHVEETDGDIVREYWNGVAGTSVANIPTGNAPSGTNILTSLEAATDAGDDYGARLRGYITAPETGNYYFWIASKDAAELWMSNDDEPINSFKRAWVTTGNATPQSWTDEGNQRTSWLALEQGKKYYIEVLHKAGTGPDDNLAVGWARPGQNENAPSEVVPGFVLSRYVEPAPGSNPGTLYLATMLSQAGAVTNGVGSSTLRLSPDENTAYMKYSYSNLTGPITSQHIHTDPYLNKASEIVFDIDTPETPGDGLITNPNDPNFGAYKWTIIPIAQLTKADIIEIIKQGKAYINLHTALYPNGEIRGNYTATVGSRTFTPPPAPPTWTDDHTTNDGAARFLTQATFGANLADIAALKGMASYDAWIEDQFTKSSSLHLPEVIRTERSSAQGGAFDEVLSFNSWWWRSITGDDQLRQRIAFALSEIHVISAQGPLDNRADAISYFYDRLLDNAFGNFRDILEDTTLTPTMGRYLDMLRNDKPDLTVGRIPNENYAREIKQLFSVGLFRMWPDGTLMLTSKDEPINVYNQREIVGFAHVFTGWDYGYDGAFRTALNAPATWVRQMREVPARHFTGPKRVLNNVVLPGLRTTGGHALDPYATHNTTDFGDTNYQNLPAQELDATHDQLFNHPNVGPFLCRQLIQRLVTSHPSRDYLYRAVQKFNDNGSGVRGDMKAVIKAILLDYEARKTTELLAIPSYGKQREPVLRVAAAGRAFRRPTWSGTYSQAGTQTITITVPGGHGLSTNGNEFLDFTTGTPIPDVGMYAVTRTSSTVLTALATGWATGTYNIPGGSTTCTVTMGGHWLGVGNQLRMDFTSPPLGTIDGANGSSIDNLTYTVATVGGQSSGPDVHGNFNNGSSFTFTVVGTTTGARSGTCMIPRFNPGSYTSAGVTGVPAGQPNDRRVTMDTITAHHLTPGQLVQLNFSAGNPQPLDMVATVETTPDLTTWTFLASSTANPNLAANQGNDGVWQFPLVLQPLTRTGNVGSRPSTFLMNNTTADLDQSPLNAPTVFNFWVPDYKFPGTLAAQGITTPEFQETAETSVIRQANFLYNGIFNSAQDSMSSFLSGNNALVLNFSPWMANTAADLGLGAPGGVDFPTGTNTRPWTHNENIDQLISQLSTLLLAGQLSPEARQIVRNVVALKISSISIGNPCTVTTSHPHNLQPTTSPQTIPKSVVCISGVTTGTFASSLNSTTTTYTATVTGPTTFTIPLNCSGAPTGGGLTNAHVSEVVYNQGSVNPGVSTRRDRIRAIVHLILTSPDFTIQR